MRRAIGFLTFSALVLVLVPISASAQTQMTLNGFSRRTIFTAMGGGTLSTAIDTIQSGVIDANLVAVAGCWGWLCVGGLRSRKRSQPG
jgi:hypothetical protein